MQDSDRAMRTQIITTLFAMYGQASDSMRIKGYVKCTEDIPTELLSKCCKKLVCELKFVPTVAEIVEAARSLTAAAKNDRVLDSTEAWGEVMANISKYGIYQKPVWSSSYIDEAVQTIGWRNLCFMQEGDRAMYAHFRDCYNSIVGRKREAAANAYVLGLIKGSVGLLEVAK